MRLINRRSRLSGLSSEYRRRRKQPVSDQRAYSRQEDRLNILIDFPTIDEYRRPMYANDGGSHRRRTERGIRQRQQARARSFPLFSREGINGAALLAVTALLVFTLLFILSQQLTGLAATQKRVTALSRSVASLQADIDAKSDDCEKKAAALNIPVEAAKIGMVSADNVETHTLHVREDATVPPLVQTGYERTETLAAIIGR